MEDFRKQSGDYLVELQVELEIGLFISLEILGL
jgi:hypothetical protein